MGSSKYLGLLIIFTSVFCIDSFSWSHCNGHSRGGAQRKVIFKHLQMSPDPIVLPGTIRIDFEAEVSGDIESPMSLEVKIWKFVKLFWSTSRIRIYGCCSYNDICKSVGAGTTCSDEFLVNCNDCTCPPTAGLYNTSRSSVSMTVNTLPFYMSFLASGKFETHLILKDGNGNVLDCLDLLLQIQTVSNDKKEVPHKPKETLNEKKEQTYKPVMPNYCYPEEKNTEEISMIMPITDNSEDAFITVVTDTTTGTN
ncbi:ganglioside GM2 activator-like [Antedon mediterranea]|uniref:ganglioside GM2 activator-like n=1 Tax=Antedon mediterranea TaxID=105859 RepID=UPI003AF9DD6C